MRRRFIPLLFLLGSHLPTGCGGGHATETPPAAVRELLGGTLDPDTLPPQPVTFSEDGLSAFGTAEVPAGSRLQAAYVLADAAARAELARLIRVRITSLNVSVVTEQAQSIRHAVMERAQATLPALTIAERGARATADGRQIKVASRIDLSRAAVVELLRPSLDGADPAPLAAATAHLLAKESSP